MLKEKQYLIDEIQQHCRINSPSKHPSPYKKKDKLYKELYERSNSECNDRKPIKKNKVVSLFQNKRNQYFQNILSLPYDDPRPAQIIQAQKVEHLKFIIQILNEEIMTQNEMITILMKNPIVRQEAEIFFLTQILCQYSFFAKIKQQYGVQIVSNLSFYSYFKKYEAQQIIDFSDAANLEKLEKHQQDNSNKMDEGNKTNEQGGEKRQHVLMILISGQAVQIKGNQINQKADVDEILCQEGSSLQKLNATDLLVDQRDFEQKLKENSFITKSTCQFIVILIQDYQVILQRNLIRLQKIKQIEKLIENKNEEAVKQYKFLQQVPIFKQFSDADIFDIMANMSLERVCHGQTLYQQGDLVKGVYIIYSGEFQIMKKQERLNQVVQYEAMQMMKEINKFIPNMDQNLVVSIIRTGEIFGFEEIIQYQQQRQYTVEATAINTFVFFLKAQYFEKKFNRLINQNEYNQLVKLTEEKVIHREQFQEKQEYFGYNLLEDIQNSSLGYQIFSKIKEDMEGNNLNKLKKIAKTHQDKNNLTMNETNFNNEKNKIYRKRLNQDSFSFLEKSLTPLQKTLPTLGKFTNNKSKQFQNSSNFITTQQAQSFKNQETEYLMTSPSDNTCFQFIKTDTTTNRQNVRSHVKSVTPKRERFVQNSTGINTVNTSQLIQFSQNSTTRQKKTIEFLRESRCINTQGDDSGFFLGQPVLTSANQTHASYKQKWNQSRRNKSQISQITYFDNVQRYEGEQLLHLTPTPIHTNPNMTKSSQFFDQSEDFDKMFVVVKNRDAEKVIRQMNNSKYGVVRAVELSNLESGNPTQRVIQQQPNEQEEQFEFANQIEDLKPIVQKRKQILERITKAIQQQTNQQELGIQLHDQLNIPRYMQVKQQRMQEQSNSQSPKKDRNTSNRKAENYYVQERSVLTKFLKDKMLHETTVICQNTDTTPVFSNAKKYSVQLGGNTTQVNDILDKSTNQQRQNNFSLGASPHHQRPPSKPQNSQLQYFQTKKVDENVRIVSRGNKSIKYRDNRSPTKVLQIQ